MYLYRGIQKGITVLSHSYKRFPTSALNCNSSWGYSCIQSMFAAYFSLYHRTLNKLKLRLTWFPKPSWIKEIIRKRDTSMSYWSNWILSVSTHQYCLGEIWITLYCSHDLQILYPLWRLQCNKWISVLTCNVTSFIPGDWGFPESSWRPGC